MEKTIDFYGTELALAPHGQDEWVFMGPDPDALLAYYRDRAAYEYTHFDEPLVRFVRPEQVGGIYISRHDADNPDDFWSAHRKDGSFDTFRSIAGRLPYVKRLMAAGVELSGMPSDGKIRKCAELYYARPKDVPVVDMGTYFLFQSNGRHRLLAAMGLDTEIAVSVIGSMRPMDGPLG